MSDLPPPVTKNSSRADLWEELEASREEIEAQQRELNALRANCKNLRRDLADAYMRLRVIQAAVTAYEVAA